MKDENQKRQQKEIEQITYEVIQYIKMGDSVRLEAEVIQKQNYYMRRRYFSPQLRETLNYLHQNSKHKLRWAGSTAKLSSSIGLSEQNQEKIGSYVFFRDKEIGCGYSSKVYKAKKVGEDQDYAIKVIQLKKYSTSNMEMLANEIKILKTLDHPNVLRCYDIYQIANRCYIVTEFCPFGDLLAHMSKRGRLSQQNAVEIIDSIITGCKYLMQNNILHRDLKPANILKSRTGWKIADFGFAVQSQIELRAKYNVGTPLYMPPEALIQNIYSHKTDIFAIGVMLYELIVGCTPWQSRTQRDLIRKMTTTAFKIPQKYAISGKVKAILTKMCKTSAQQRMSKQQFMKMDIKHLDNIENPQQKPIIRKGNERSLQNVKYRLTHKSAQILPRVKTLISNRSGHQDDRQEYNKNIDVRNNHILINQLHYCRFLYYFVRNSHNILLEGRKVQKLTLIIFKHLLKLTKQLADSSFNWFKLKDWSRFKCCKKYLNTHLTIKQYAIRYEKEYMVFLKTLEVSVIREVNQDFVQFSNISAFTVDFYQKILNYVGPQIRSFNHNLGIKLAQLSEVEREEAGEIEALKCLFKYYELVEMSCQKFQDHEYFEQKSSIKVHVDFKKVGNTLTHYQTLRQAIKNI